MNTKAALLITVCAIGTRAAHADRPVEPQSPPVQIQTSSPAFTNGDAVIEEVISAVDDGYRFRAYVVRWHGARVLVSDPPSESNGAVGDTIHFMVTRHDVDGRRLLSFIGNDLDAARHGKATQNNSLDSSNKLETGTATIEEVLHAEDGGYHFVAYLASWHGSRIAICDPLASSHAGHIATTTDTATVEEVLTTRVQSNRFVAYIVKWHGTRVAISDMFATTHYAVGDQIEFPVSRVDSSHQPQLCFMLFTFPARQPKTPVPQEAGNGPSQTPF